MPLAENKDYTWEAGPIEVKPDGTADVAVIIRAVGRDLAHAEWVRCAEAHEHSWGKCKVAELFTAKPDGAPSAKERAVAWLEDALRSQPRRIEPPKEKVKRKMPDGKQEEVELPIKIKF